MSTRIVVDDELGNIKSTLKEKGFTVLGMNELDKNPDVVIVSGMEKNVMGIQDIQTDVPIISVLGMDEDEVIKELYKKIHINH
ncbi:MAG: YkuS family protein [Desulfobacterales bacterium]|nr:YkuS family protein [Desulfobacterales bacterium]